MGLKRGLFSAKKHYWHLSHKKLKRMNLLFEQIEAEHKAVGKGSGSFVLIKNEKERRESEC